MSIYWAPCEFVDQQVSEWVVSPGDAFGAQLTAFSLGTVGKTPPETDPRHFQEPPIFALSVNAAHRTVACFPVLSHRDIVLAAPTVGHRSILDTGWSHTCRHWNTWGGKPGGVSLRQPAGVTLRLNRVNFFSKCCQTFNQSWQDFGKTPDEQNSALSCLLQL